MSWYKGEPRKRRKSTVTLRYQDADGTTSTGDFYWNDDENAWLESIEGPDGIGLYAEDGWKILGWKR